MQTYAAATQVSPSTAPEPRQKLAKASSEFEALLIGQMLRSARESCANDDDSDGNSAIYETAEQQFAQVLANNGGLGIAKMVMSGIGNDANR